MTNQAERVHIIGIGNLYRHDDAAGLRIARELTKLQHERICVSEHGGDGSSLIELWDSNDCVVMVDAVSSGDPVGRVRRLDALETPLPKELFCCSTHAFGVADAVELARALDRLPRKLVVFGIEGANFSAGVGLSSELEQAIPAAAQRIWSDAVQMTECEDNSCTSFH